LFGWWFHQLLVFIGISHTFFTSDYTSLCSSRVSLFISTLAIRRYGCKLVRKKVVSNCHLLDVKGNLLISVYIHSILPPFHLHLVLSFVMPSALVHSFVFFSNTFKT
jgi:hypothetical protein